ncbi:MAG: hypothetical protein J0J01_17100 [Reyranella sp.]|uniref:hypothetical protein n=1 Tax=Reyranella sp. TaxID=1929291 RepID=UPI001ACD4C33|nr:hypothetical protein [Reyranella sp.]MBN9088623.1 hypothetical protein [Reyranella sp.]
MLGEKKTLPFWRKRRPNFLGLERALKPEGVREERHTDAEHAVIERKIAKDRFEVSKGRIHPPT